MTDPREETTKLLTLTRVALVACSSESAAQGGDYVIVAENPPPIADVECSIRRISAFPYWRGICNTMVTAA